MDDYLEEILETQFIEFDDEDDLLDESQEV